MRLSLPPRALSALRVLFTAAACYWIFRYLERTAGGLAWPEEFDASCIVLGVLLIPVNIALRALKWQRIARLAEPRVTLGEAAASYLGALPLSMITPGRVGEFSRFAYFRHRSLQGWEAASLVVADKFTDLLTVMAWSVPGFARLFGMRGLLCALAALVLAAFLPAILPAIMAGLPKPRAILEAGPLGRMLGKILPPPGRFRARALAAPVAIGLAAYAVEWLQFALMVDAFTVAEVPYAPLAGLTAVIILANAFQLTVGGLGLREGLSLVLLAPLGVPPEAAVLSAFALFCLGQLIPACAGLAIRPVALERSALAPPADGVAG